MSGAWDGPHLFTDPKGAVRLDHTLAGTILFRYSLNSSRSRFVCARLTGISVCRLSLMRNW